MPNSLEWAIAELEGIASNSCYCEEDGDDRCKPCTASGILNEISEIVHYGLEQLR